jgi:hypothetical protein
VRFLFASLFLVLTALSVLPQADAAPAAHVEKETSGANVPLVAIAPHRAIYDMTLTSVKNGSNISDVSGKMIFEWADACDGWAIQQNLQLHFSYAEGDQSNVTSNEVTWESKDGKHYNFNIRRLNDGKETENYRGKASVADGKGKAVYSTPEGKLVALTDETIFPSAHTRLIIAKANSGERFFTRRVFDGTDEGGSNDVSVFIAPAVAHTALTGADADLAASPLLAAAAWPVHMAFFKLDDETGAPDYEMDLSLLANGVARSMKIDYGDFSVTGNLKAIEPLPAPHC